METFITLLVWSAMIGFATSAELTFCSGKRIKNLEELSSLKECDVIEGNFIIGFNIASSTEEWRKNGELQVREITGFVILCFLDHLTSLDLILPNLRVIRGSSLYENYALIIYGLMDLKSISLNNLTTILNGSVFIRNNPLLDYYTHRVLWDKMTYWNSGSDLAHMNVIQHVESPVVMCNETCRANNSSEGYCWSAGVCQKVCSQSDHSLSCSPSGDPCDEECVGGCYIEKNETKCFACKNFRNSNGCSYSCFPKYELNGYRCVSDVECLSLGRKLQESRTLMRQCVKECSQSYKEDRTNPSLCVPCSGCPKVCKMPSVVDSAEKALQLSGCTKIDGSLEIRVYGKRIQQTLLASLGQVREVEGYVRVFQSRELRSLKFLEHIVKINGKELWQNKYSLIVYDNDDLEELWNTTTSKLNIVQGKSLFYANPKLCTQNIETLIGRRAWRESVSDDNIRGVLNGNKKACNINKKFDFDIEPLYEEGGLAISVITKTLSRSEEEKLAGYYIFYKKVERENEIISYDGRHWQHVFAEHKNDGPVTLRLKPATRYAIYLEGKSTDPWHNFQSVIKYGTTKPFNPSPPEDVKVSQIGIDFVEVSWQPPRLPNGEVDHYVIEFNPIKSEQYHNLSMCDSAERKKYFEFFEKEIEKQKRIAKDEEEEKTATTAPAKKICPLEEAAIEESVDRIREHSNMADKLSELIYASDLSSIRKKRDIGNYLPIETICIHIDRQSLRTRPSGLSRKLGMSSNATNTLRLNLEESLKKYLESPENLLIFKEKLQNYEHDLSVNCASFLFNFLGNLTSSHHAKFTKRNDFAVENNRLVSQQENITGTIVYGTRFRITNFTSSSYDFSIMACHRQLNSSRDCEYRSAAPCKLCSRWYKARINFILKNEKYRSNLTIVKIYNNNVTISWTRPQYLQNNEILYYTIYVQAAENSPPISRNLQTHCVSSATNQASFLFPEIGNYTVTIAGFSAVNGELMHSNPVSFNINENITRSNNAVVILTLMFLLVVFLVGVYVYMRITENKQPEKLIRLGLTNNPCYQSGVHPWKDYLEKKIDKNDIFYSPNNLTIEKNKFDQGNFGVIHTAYLELSNGVSRKVAVKKLRPDTDGMPSKCAESSEEAEGVPIRYRELIDEASLMLQIKSYHLVEMFGVAFIYDELHLVMEFMDNKSLSNYIKKNKLLDCQMVQIAIQIADGMAYLSYKKILHMDLAARNCLLDRKLNAKVSDFGLSRRMTGKYYRIQEKKAVPIRWMPPESVNDNKFTTNSDVWSFGVLLWEIVNPGKLPYEDKADEDVKEEVGRSCWPGSISKRAPFADMISWCWKSCPNDRPSFETIVKDLLRLKTINEDFKRYFESNSFYYCREYPEEGHRVEAETDERDITPSTPLTTNSLNAQNCRHGAEDSLSLQLQRQFSSIRSILSKSFPFISRVRAAVSSQNKDEINVEHKEVIADIEKDLTLESVICTSPSQNIMLPNHFHEHLISEIEIKNSQENHILVPNGSRHISSNGIMCNRLINA